MSLNFVKNSIGWCDYTWNPVSGCKRDCSYCYAKKIHSRFYKYPFSEIQFHQSRIKDLEKLQSGKSVFVGSMSDIEYWSQALCLRSLVSSSGRVQFHGCSK